MAKAEPQIVAALTSFVGGVGSAELHVVAGELFASDDPLVRKFPKLFGPVKLRSSGPRIEQATAAPGEKRGD